MIHFIAVVFSPLLKRPRLQYPAPIIEFFDEIWPNLGNLSRHNVALVLYTRFRYVKGMSEKQWQSVAFD